MWHHIIPLSDQKIDSSRSPLSGFFLAPGGARIEVPASEQFSIVDFFDTIRTAQTHFSVHELDPWNTELTTMSVGHSEVTLAAMFEFTATLTVRFPEALMPKSGQRHSHLDADGDAPARKY